MTVTKKVLGVASMPQSLRGAFGTGGGGAWGPFFQTPPFLDPGPKGRRRNKDVSASKGQSQSKVDEPSGHMLQRIGMGCTDCRSDAAYS